MDCIVYTEQGKRVFVGGLRMALPIAMMFATSGISAQIINKSEQYIVCLSNVGNAIRSKIINTKTLNTTVQDDEGAIFDEAAILECSEGVTSGY